MEDNACRTCKFSAVCHGLGMQAVLQYIADDAHTGVAGVAMRTEDFERTRRVFIVQLPTGCSGYKRDDWSLFGWVDHIEVRQKDEDGPGVGRMRTDRIGVWKNANRANRVTVSVPASLVD